jgi:uncharacterized protein
MFMNDGTLGKTKIYIERTICEGNSIYEAYPEYLSREIREKILRGKSPFSSEYITAVFPDDLKSISGAGIIIAPSSMLTGGPSVEYLKMISADPNNKLILISYQSPNTPASNIKAGQKEVTICEQKITIGCQVEAIDGLNIHSDYNQLLAYVNKLRPKVRRVLVNHGERSKVQNLATSINKTFKIQSQYPLVGEGIKLL